MNRREAVVRTVAAALGLSGLVGAQKQKLVWTDLPVSLVRIIANPNLLDGRRVRVMGYLEYGVGLDQSFALYLSEIDGKNANDFNAVSVRHDTSKLKAMMGKNVFLNGTYHAPHDGYESGHNGYIDKVSDLRESKFGDDKK
ncbi:MAG: hypothetical protein JWO20_1819 [Candidatus Angelobacter sp.]|jgi:hypothetical protein|nr:hypothetical protein [Candidatus Angelobacter sp.]